MGLRAKPAASNGGICRLQVNGSDPNGNSPLRKPTAAPAKPNHKTAPSKPARTLIASTTYRSSSTSSLMACGRPQTLNVRHLRETPTDQTKLFFGEIISAWRAKARCNVVPADRTQELFHELSFHPSEKQIGEILQTVKMLARKRSHPSEGLTFGEFCVLAADLKRFRISAVSSTICNKADLSSSLEVTTEPPANPATNCSFYGGSELRSTKSLSNVEDCKKKLAPSTDSSAAVEVFLGGSCNPTTWRADVAIPTLKSLGISFYNPQVSDWTPDLIELEHRAKEKARVLFFVMDSETRASAGAIEAAHIAGQNCKQLVLVLHPYKPNQYILNEPISQQEYVDLMRNQMILKELVTRRGLPVLENIPSGLQRTKEILAGIRDPPSNIASILVVVRGAFNRVNPVDDLISLEQCQRALLYLGYAQSLLNLDNISKIVASQRAAISKLSTKECDEGSNSTRTSSPSETASVQEDSVDFELFCVISAYLSVLQQEIHESGCISPIKGTNLPPPPVYLANMQGGESFPNNFTAMKSTSTSVTSSEERELLGRSRDSGTSSPQPIEPLKSKSAANLGKQNNRVLVKVEVTSSQTNHTLLNTAPSQTPPSLGSESIAAEEESDSNDSVFSSSSSINSVTCNYSEALPFACLDFRDVYLGGSCFLRTKWRQDVAMPYLKSKGVTFHLPALHESIKPSQLDLPDKVFEEARSVGAQVRSVIRSRRKCRGGQVEDDEVTISQETLSWALPPVRPNLYNPSLLDSSRVLLFVITNETRSLAPMTLAAHCIGLMYNVVLAVQMLPDDCVISNEKLTTAAIKDYNRGRSYLIDLAKRQGVPVFSDLKAALECTVEKVKACSSRSRFD